MMEILLLNGAFGVGKTTLANELLRRRPDWMLFDPEEVGAMLWRVCPEPRGDFQDLAAWAPLVVETARVLVRAYGRSLVVPMTLTGPENFETIRAGFEGMAPTRHFTLVAPSGVVEQRLTERGDAVGSWAFQQIERCEVLRRPEFAVHLDAELPVGELAERVLRR